MNATSAVRSRPALSPPSSFLSRRFTRCGMSMPKLRLRTPSPPHATTNGRENTPDSALLAASDEEVGKPRGSRDVQLELARRVHASSWLPVADPAPNAKPIEPAYGGSFLKESRVRATWLLGLLVLQSLSSFVLEANQALIKEHLVVTLFLTMLVGAGGNSGAQSAVHVIRGLATGQFACSLDAYVNVLQQQLRVGLLLGTALAMGGYVRVVVTEGVPLDAVAIAGSLFVIVNSSVLVGTSLPFALAWRGVDPAHAGTTVQVIMDVAGVAITCAVCRLLLIPASMPTAAAEVLSQAAAVAGDSFVP